MVSLFYGKRYMAKKDLDYIAGLEKAVEEKYGKEAIVNPISGWDDDKEASYIKQRQERDRQVLKDGEKEQVIEKGGFLVKKKLVNSATNRTCPSCIRYSFSIRDDVYMNKFSCCYECFVQYVEGREEEWQEKKELSNVS